MKIWYRAVCDTHKETIRIFVDNPTRTALYLSTEDDTISTWLELHRNCNLRLICRDDQLDEIFSNGYSKV